MVAQLVLKFLKKNSARKVGARICQDLERHKGKSKLVKIPQKSSFGTYVSMLANGEDRWWRKDGDLQAAAREAEFEQRRGFPDEARAEHRQAEDHAQMANVLYASGGGAILLGLSLATLTSGAGAAGPGLSWTFP